MVNSVCYIIIEGFQTLKFCGCCSTIKKALWRREQKKKKKGKKPTIVLKELCIFDTNYQRKIDSQVHIIIMSDTIYYCLFHWLLAFLECKLLLVRVVHFFILLFKISSTENALWVSLPYLPPPRSLNNSKIFDYKFDSRGQIPV